MKSHFGAWPTHPQIVGFERLPLPRLLHFVDLVLPHIVPVSSPSQSSSVTFPGSQLVRDQWIAREQGRAEKTINIVVSRFFKSHAAIDHLTVHWNGMPVLLFADMNTEEYASVWEYQFAKAVTTLRQNVTMGLKKGHTVLFHFSILGVQYQAIMTSHPHDGWVCSWTQRRREPGKLLEACIASTN